MNPYALPPVAAGFAAMMVAVSRRASTLSLELFSGAESTVEATMVITYGSRFVSFGLVYGLVFGLAYWVGTRTTEPRQDGRFALTTGAVGAVGYLGATAVVFQWIDVTYPGTTAIVVTEFGAGIAVAIQLAVVAFAGATLARRRE